MPNPGPILVFQSTHLTYKAERLLKNSAIPCNLVTKPRHISSDCGLAIHLEEQDRARGLTLLSESGVEPLGVW